MESLFHPSWGYAATVVLTMGGYLLALVLIPRILLDRRDPEATMAWILAIIFLPYLGAAAFYLLGRTRVRRRTRKKLLARFRVQRSLNTLPETSPAVDIPPAGAGREVAKLVRYVTENPLVPGNRVRIFTGGEAAYDQMEAAIESAREHIHLMSYIFHKDEIGHRFLDLLTQQAERGVEVRLLVDAFGASDLPGSFVKPLIEAGGRFSRFGPMLGAKRRWRPNLRNHRKILVVDGRIGFTGGLNIGDEYRGRKEKWRPWRDTHLGLDGPAVRYLQAVFVEDWMFSQGEDLAESRYFPEIPEQGRELVQVVDSGPDHDHETIHTVFFTAINEASDRIWITTPYFVPTPAMLLALKSAAWRGLDVRILLPGRSDMKLAQMAGRSYYPELIEAGVRIFEHRPGILHAKTMVADGGWSTIGSANMDIRSFRLNYEVNVLVWGKDMAGRMEEIFLNDLEGALEVTADRLASKRPLIRLTEALIRPLSPLL